MLTREKKHCLLKSASNRFKDVDRVLICYTDINSCLKFKWKDEPSEDDFFNSIDSLQGNFENLI